MYPFVSPPINWRGYNLKEINMKVPTILSALTLLVGTAAWASSPMPPNPAGPNCHIVQSALSKNSGKSYRQISKKVVASASVPDPFCARRKRSSYQKAASFVYINTSDQDHFLAGINRPLRMRQGIVLNCSVQINLSDTLFGRFVFLAEGTARAQPLQGSAPETTS